MATILALSVTVSPLAASSTLSSKKSLPSSPLAHTRFQGCSRRRDCTGSATTTRCSYIEEQTADKAACSVSSLPRAVVGALTLVASVVALQLLPAHAYIGGGPYGREVTRGQDLTGKDFSNRDLTQQDFKTSILRQANFKGSKLVGASFFDSDLTGADLSDTDLRGADFSLCNAQKTNFTNANFEGATVTGNTSFKNAIITGADFTDVQFRDDQRKLLCKVASGTNPVTGNDTKDTLFCPP